MGRGRFARTMGIGTRGVGDEGERDRRGGKGRAIGQKISRGDG